MTVPPGPPPPGAAHELLVAAVSYADLVLDAVGPQLLSRPTPCRAWDLRTLLEHAEESVATLHEGVTEHRVALIPPPAPARPAVCPAAVLVAAFRERAAALLAASACADGDRPVTVGGYPLPADSLRATAALEIAVHAWDISQSCGQQLPIPDEQAAGLLAQARLLVPRLGRHPMFAAPVPPLARSTPSDRLAGYLGRPAGWASLV
ncbi:MAG TPA: TIGR03086 family metal-binding protein [Trebonia sp.]|nr:TIGR03086 family metal-binding protein [Trebonia sp.]